MAKSLRIILSLVGLLLLWLPFIPSILTLWGITLICIVNLISEFIK